MGYVNGGRDRIVVRRPGGVSIHPHQKLGQRDVGCGGVVAEPQLHPVALFCPRPSLSTSEPAVRFSPVNERVLLVEDDPSIREVATLGLEQAGYRVSTAGDGREGLLRSRDEPFDLVILDVMLPSLDGFEVCREIRKQSQVPILMLTARSDTIDVVVGLESGADDYVTKPFEMAELVARARAVLRRSSAAPLESAIELADLEIDPASFSVKKNGKSVSLTATEFRLLLEMARRPGQVFTRELLLDRVWNYDYLGDSRLVDVAVQRLRAKVEDDPAHPRLITTVRGVGYRLERAY
jgi:DNA-binding response OmpR family regulator